MAAGEECGGAAQCVEVDDYVAAYVEDEAYSSSSGCEGSCG